MTKEVINKLINILHQLQGVKLRPDQMDYLGQVLIVVEKMLELSKK